jgi:ribosomal protein S18 acetylase RimI-like enzyme
MESEKSMQKNNFIEAVSPASNDELAKLTKISEINNLIEREFGEITIHTADESFIKELGELWANLASVQQLSDSQRYNFFAERKDWQQFVRNKIEKKNNLLLIARKKGNNEVRGFLYLQTITLPSSDLVLKGVVEDIYTKPQYRKQHIASQMLEVALLWAAKQNIKQIDLITLEKPNVLLSFYEKVLNRIKLDINIDLLKL